MSSGYFGRKRRWGAEDQLLDRVAVRICREKHADSRIKEARQS